MTKARSTKVPSRSTRKKRKLRPLSLYPLSFDEAVTDILKVKPEPKPRKKREK